jgi:two-component system sensor histidine kinase RstB
LPEFQDVTKPASQTTLTSAFLASAILSGLLVYSLSSKFRQIENVALSIARGNLSARVDEHKAGETIELAKALNLMASRTESMIQSKRELLQMVSHELRTPLSRLRFAADLLESRPDDPKRSRRLDIINQSINELDTLIAEILEFVKNNEYSPTRSQEWIDVRRVVEPIVKAIIEETPGIAIECMSGPQGQTPVIYSDRIAFLRVAKNILGNAQRYAQSRIVIRVLVKKEENPSRSPGGQSSSKSYKCVEFEDDGPGIPEEKWLEVIEPFVRLHSGSQSDAEPSPSPDSMNRVLYRNHTGIGLGLAIVNRILKQHGGRLEIDKGSLGGCLVRTYWPNPASQPPMI